MRFILLALGLVLTACASVNPVAVAKMARLDPLSFDPGALAARLTLPEGAEVPRDGAVFRLTITRDDAGSVTNGRFAFAQNGEVWRLAPQDAERLRAMQVEVRALKSQGVSGKAEVGMELTICPEGEIRPDDQASAAVSIDGGQSFLTLIRPTPVAKLLRDAGAEDGALPDLCKIE